MTITEPTAVGVSISGQTNVSCRGGADGTATAGSGDYQPASGTLTFSPGVLTQTITVLVNGDTTFENDETFTVGLSNVQNATIATGTMTANDVPFASR